MQRLIIPSGLMLGVKKYLDTNANTLKISIQITNTNICSMDVYLNTNTNAQKYLNTL